jgi:serine/threonine protein kinase
MTRLKLKSNEIIDVVHAGPDSTRPDVFSIWMPFCDHTLQHLLDSPLFAPHHPFITQEETPSVDSFLSVARCIISQMLSAIAYLHHPVQGIGHRDIKPANFLLSRDGYVKLIDFGISYELNAKDRTEDLWPERADELYVQVSTGYVTGASSLALELRSPIT